ncbi:carboxypeptidase-like regulatory domain-containing protein [Ulvibacterium marinum]|uniref:Carboxypeptidase regulatory-like domain-containing protein n=1 Tax=Ulvibacterium marinum TaxID=2419782 RepID=A0A3B0CHB4_9FLAO|nr:carboxypeptidase-like regulatory domain-containing protein [Ulvibacterium marinum]RKN82666.1 carboxypeptidase regulatory-like domain-containing protein [Ulvibacterium marinum]
MELARQNRRGTVFNAPYKLIPQALLLIAFFAMIICLTLLLSCSNGDDTTGSQGAGIGEVMGSVKDEDGNPYPNTVVKLSTGATFIETKTDSDGNFDFNDVAGGTHEVTISLPLSTEGVTNTSTAINVQDNQTVTVDFVIRPLQVKAHLNFGNVQLLEEIKDENGNTPTDPDEPLYAENIFDEPLGLLTAIKTPDGEHVTLSEFKSAQGNLMVHCNGDTSIVEIALEGMIPNGTYTFWLAYLNKTRSVGEPIDFANDFVNFTNPPIGSASGTENIVVATEDGTINTSLQHTSCILTDEVALVIPVLYHINGKTFGGGHVPDPEEMVQMLAYFQ